MVRRRPDLVREALARDVGAGRPCELRELGAGLIVADVPPLAFAVGVYLPFDLNVPIFLGGLIALFVNRALDKANASEERRGQVERNGFLVAAGFITGESLMGIGIAVPVAATEDKGFWVVANGAYEHLKIPGLVIVGITMVLLYTMSLRAPKPKAT